MFQVKQIDETKEIIKQQLYNYPLDVLEIDVDQALDFVTSEDIVSKEDVPHFHRSIVDGYAVTSRSVQFASATTPTLLNIRGTVEMGKESAYTVDEEHTVYVPTGGHLPKGADCVVMIEQTEVINDELFVYKSVSKWENVMQKGTDIQQGAVVIPKHTTITPLLIGLLKSLGIQVITVFRQLHISVISTGDELVGDQETLAIGEIRDINTHTIKHYLQRKHCIVDKTTVVRDDVERYKQAILDGFSCSDIVIASGASSVGDKDYTIDALTSIGAEILVHGVNIKPGKPTIIATVQGKLFFGLPGQPTSAFIVLNTFFPTIYHELYGLTLKPIPYQQAVLTKHVHSVTGRRMVQIVSLEQRENQLYATPLFAKSGMIQLLSHADGYIVLDEHEEGLEPNTNVLVYRLED